jgi:hypothetical protein
MRTAPSVSVSCSGGLGWRWAQSLIPALAMAAFAAWTAGHRGWRADHVALVALLGASLVGSLAWWWAAPRSVVMQWDGQQWSADGSVVNVVVMMDLPRWLLLRLRFENGPSKNSTRWTAVSAADAGPAWHGLRVALFARASNQPDRPLADLGPHV